MPIYCYTCPVCTNRAELMRPIEDREPPECPECGQALMDRDFTAEGPTIDTLYQKEQISTAAGIHPDQIPEMTRKFPHHRFVDRGERAGDMIFHSHRHRERCMKDIGMHDRND